MQNGIRRRDGAEIDRPAGAAPGSVRRLGSIAGLATIGVLDLLALDDITTAGAWMPEIAFVIASLPALATLGWFAFRRARPDPGLSGADPERRLLP